MKKLSLFIAALLICSGIVAQDATQELPTRKKNGIELGESLGICNTKSYGTFICTENYIHLTSNNAFMGLDMLVGMCRHHVENDYHYQFTKAAIGIKLGYRIQIASHFAFSPILGLRSNYLIFDGDPSYYRSENEKYFPAKSDPSITLGFDIDFSKYKLTHGGSRFRLLAPTISYTFQREKYNFDYDFDNPDDLLNPEPAHTICFSYKIGFVKVKK